MQAGEANLSLDLAHSPGLTNFESDLCLTAIDKKLDPVDEACIIGSEKEYRISDFFGLANPTGGNQLGKLILDTFGLRTTAKQMVETGGIRQAGTDGIDADTAILEVKNPVAGKISYRRFGCGIDAEIFRTCAAGRGCGQYDRSAIAQHRKRLLHREEDALHVGIERALIMFLRDRSELQELTSASIGKQYINLRMLLLDRIVKPVDIGEIGRVTLHAGHIATNCLYSGIERFLPATRNEYGGSLCCKCFCGREADAACAACYHYNFVFKLVHYLSPFTYGQDCLAALKGDEPETMRLVVGKNCLYRSIYGTIMKSDLNDFAYFAEVVTHGGFAAAARVLREPKSKLSRRVARLEKRLGIRLIERTSRRFRVTDVGQGFYERCRTIQQEAEQAEALVTQAQSEPHGLIRFSCPTGIVEVISGLIGSFLERYPKMRLQLIAIDRPVDLIGERIDLALRVRVALTSDAELTMRSLGNSTRILVASPAVAGRLQDIEQLTQLPTLVTNDTDAETEWYLETEDGRTQKFRHEARLGCGDMVAVRDAAIAGLGIALLPYHVCLQALADGRLIRTLPEWRGQKGVVHLVFTTRRGLPPAVRALIDHLAAGFPRDILDAPST